MIPLRESVSATLGADGAATVSVGPTRPGQSWNIRRLSTSVTPKNGGETVRVYLDSVSDLNYLDGSRRAFQDTSETTIEVGNLNRLVIVYAGGTPGAIATMNILGDVL